jgi:hypothetical protein
LDGMKRLLAQKQVRRSPFVPSPALPDWNPPCPGRVRAYQVGTKGSKPRLQPGHGPCNQTDRGPRAGWPAFPMDALAAEPQTTP